MFYMKDWYSGPKYDPRTKHWVEYKCPCCNNLHQVDITRKNGYDMSKEIKCPHCGKLNANDSIEGLKKEIDRLTENRRAIDIQIEELERKIENNDFKIETEAKRLF